MKDYKKLYEDALERARKLYDSSEYVCEMDSYATIFPELKESEDERIRKELMDYIIIYRDSIEEEEFKSWLAWLEKQGLQNLANSAKTCKVEPKFKVGDWIVYDKYGEKDIDRIVKFDNDKASFESGEWLYIHQLNENCKLWSIQDAKDGDVLATTYFIFIFKNIDSGNGVHYYCQYETSPHENDNQFDTALPQSLMGRVGNSNYSPATKEQRELLFSKMKEAGYEWDVEKKELKIIDWSKHVKCNLDSPSTEQESAWSEEDEKMLNDAIGAIGAADYYSYDDKQEIENWLKSLQNRI